MSNRKKPRNPWLRLGPPGTRIGLKGVQKPNRRRTQNYKRARYVEELREKRES